MSYAIKEIYYTLQGEGHYAGRPAVFCRFSGCNLWNGKKEDKANSSCWFCDTDFVGIDGENGGKYKAKQLADKIKSLWPTQAQSERPFVVFTGGEPLLQLDAELIKACKSRNIEIAIESNGTIRAPKGIDWITISPKPKSEIIQTVGNELKLAFPHDVTPESVESYKFEHLYLSPINTEDEKESKEHLKQAMQFCKENPKWKLTQQYHKIWGIP